MPPPAYFNAPKHLGDHLHRRRDELHLLQREAAGQLHVTAQTYANWEQGSRLPALRHWPGIIRFLGYDPRPIGAQLKRHREALGWSGEEAAAGLGVNPSVLWRWETGRRKPKGTYLVRVYAFLGGDPQPSPTTFGERLKRHREQAALTMRAVALELKVAESTLCRWEAGDREPQGEYLARAERWLGSVPQTH